MNDKNSINLVYTSIDLPQEILDNLHDEEIKFIVKDKETYNQWLYIIIMLLIVIVSMVLIINNTLAYGAIKLGVIAWAIFGVPFLLIFILFRRLQKPNYYVFTNMKIHLYGNKVHNSTSYVQFLYDELLSFSLNMKNDNYGVIHLQFDNKDDEYRTKDLKNADVINVSQNPFELYKFILFNYNSIE